MPDAVDLPYPPRPGQAEAFAAIRQAQQEGGHLVLEAGTGTGKTVTALAASLGSARRDGRRLLVATRTNSQQTQFIAEHKALADARQDPGLLVPMMGRRQYCPLLRSDERFADGTPEELGRLCRDAKRRAVQQAESGQPVAGACPFYAKLLQDGEGPVEALLRSGGLHAGDLAGRIEAAGSCPYEALKLLLAKADTVVVPAVFVLDAHLRGALLQWMGVGADQVHLVVDEAHHLPEAAREHHSPRLTSTTIIRALREAEEYRDPTLGGCVLATGLLDALQRTLHALLAEWVRDGEDGLIPPGALEESLLQGLRIPTPKLEGAVADLERWGDIVREDRRAKGRLPRSHMGSVAGFLRVWLASRDAHYVHLVTAGDNPSLEMLLLDTAAVLGFLDDCWSTIHMSGTLAPLEEHARLCGLDRRRTRLLAVPSPFDPRHLEVYGLEGVQRRFEAVRNDPTLTARQQDSAREVLAGWRRRGRAKTGLFFPSHQMMRDYLEEGLLHDVEGPLYVEAAGMSSLRLAELVQAFRDEPDPDAMLVGVLGGRLTEGVDFPGNTLRRMLVFGVPYPRPTARLQALIHHHDRTGGDGWACAVHNPTARVLRQAIGRMVRGPDDRGTALVLDDRIVRFRAQIPRLRMLPDAAAAGAESPAGPEWEGYRTADLLSRGSPPGTG